MDEFVYDCISDWDKYFEDGDDWFNEEDNDMKDNLRDQVLDYLATQRIGPDDEEKIGTSS